MALSGNPRMMAHDIAKGLMSISPASLKRYSPQDLKTLLTSLNMALREVRGKAVPPDDMKGMKDRNQKIQNLNQAITIVNNYAKQRRIQL